MIPRPASKTSLCELPAKEPSMLGNSKQHRLSVLQRQNVYRRRRLMIIIGMVVLLLVAMSVPMTMMLAVTSSMCENASRDPTWFQQVNPLSLVSRCRRYHQGRGTPVDEVQGQQGQTYNQQPAVSQPVFENGASLGDSKQQQQVAEADKQRLIEEERQRKEDEKRRLEEENKKQAEALAKQKLAEEEERHSKQFETDRQLNADDTILPKTDADYERILSMPHFDECNLCKVCVPLSVLEHHPKAQEYLARKQTLTPQAMDDDIVINVPANSNPQLDQAAGQGMKRTILGTSTKQSQQYGQHNSHMRHLQQTAGSSNTSQEEDGIYRVGGREINISDIAPGDTKAGPRASLPNCTVCWGCRHNLEPMASGKVMAGSYYSHEIGGSPSWLFRIRTPRTQSGWAIVKIWCIPVRKAKQRGLAMCVPKKVYAQVKLLLAQQKVVHECGLNAVVPKLWVEPVSGVIPGHGFRIDWMGLWAEVAEGLSVQNIQEAGNPPTNPSFMLDLFTNKVNHTEIAMLAIFDVMFTQCDRHQQNIFLTEQGKVYAIDNDQVPGTAWRDCGVDSMVLPTTQKFMINHLGFFYVLKHPQKDPPRQPSTILSPLLLLDYRCHVEKGEIGFNYPPALKTCMRKLSSLSNVQLQQAYGYPTLMLASALRNRSADLLSHGFEWTLLYGQPTNQPMHRYKIAPSCCSMNVTVEPGKAPRYACTHPYQQMTELPYGNPWHGGKWHGTEGKDTGAYEGGTVFR